jgi:hypothetical protein
VSDRDEIAEMRADWARIHKILKVGDPGDPEYTFRMLQGLMDMAKPEACAPWTSPAELKANRDFWEAQAKEAQASADYYQAQLVDAHALVGRIVHQMSERWDRVNLTKHHPTDNLHNKRRVGDIGGAK